MNPTVEQVRNLLDYDHVTGVFEWKKRSGSTRGIASWNSKYPGKKAGSLNQQGYRQISINGDLHSAHKMAWMLCKGSWPTGEIDHIDGNKDNNAISNLRPATRSQNCANVPLSTRSKTGYKGVNFRKNRGFYTAQITFRGTRYYLGIFSNPEDAADAYDRAALACFGGFAWLNFPNKYMLADLRAGYSPEELGLEPEETGEDVDV